MEESIFEELIRVMSEHQASVGKPVRTLRLHESLWDELKESVDNCVSECSNNTNMFNGANVSIVGRLEDPMGFFRYSIQS